MAHNYRWNVDSTFVDMNFPGVVVGQYQATLPEFTGWAAVPSPVPLWEPGLSTRAQARNRYDCDTPSGRHESYPVDHILYCSYHRNSLEGLAAGCVVVNGVGFRPAIGDMLRRCAGGAASPFVFARLDELEQELEDLILLGPATLALRGSSARQWMEQNWQFEQQWDRCWRPAVDAALTRAAPNTEGTDATTPP
jgi:hypothetical protein